MWFLAVIKENKSTVWTLCIYYWICCFTCCAKGEKYSITEICDSQDGSVKISLDQGSYAQLDITMDMDEPGTDCEVVVQTTHKDDGLLLYFENFDFSGSNLATVYRRQDCGPSLLRIWDGEFRYLSSCVGKDLKKAPPMTTFSSLGAVKLQLLSANMTGPGTKSESAATAKKSPVNFTVIATASQKASVSDTCPSGCCRDPYNFKCPLLNYCIDVKLTCNNVTNCGPRVNQRRDENGLLCNNQLNSGGAVQRILEPSDVQRVITADDTDTVAHQGDMLRPVWSHDSDSAFGDIGNTDISQSFYTRVELVCGIISIALFCLAGIGVLVCRARANSRLRNPSGTHLDTVRTIYLPSGDTSSSQMPGTINMESDSGSHLHENSRSSPGLVRILVTGGGGGSGTSEAVLPNRTSRCEHCCSIGSQSADGVYAIDILGIVHRPNCPRMELLPPPAYDSLFPKERSTQDA